MPMFRQDDMVQTVPFLLLPDTGFCIGGLIGRIMRIYPPWTAKFNIRVQFHRTQNVEYWDSFMSAYVTTYPTATVYTKDAIEFAFTAEELQHA